MSDPELLSREEVLGGLPAGRARTALFLVESKTAHLIARAQQAMDVHLTEEGERQRASPSRRRGARWALHRT
jgi:hypothetical protein